MLLLSAIPIKPLVELDVPENPPVPIVPIKSPKSVAFPVVLMVTKSITLLLGEVGDAFPPANTARVDDDKAPELYLVWVKSPKSIAFPNDSKVI